LIDSWLLLKSTIDKPIKLDVMFVNRDVVGASFALPDDAIFTSKKSMAKASSTYFKIMMRSTFK